MYNSKFFRTFILLCMGLSAQDVFSQQVYEADNGVTASGSGTTRKVSLGGTLTGHTGINLSNYNLNFTGTGSLGIRTTSPQAPLHVYKSVSGNYNPVMILEDGLNDGYVMFQMKGTGRMYHLGVGNAGESYFGLTNKFFIWDQNAALPRLVVDPTGNVGIGTTSPGNRLSVAGASAGTSGLQFTQLNSSSTAVAGNGKVLGLDATGNVILVNEGGGSGSGWSMGGNSGTTAGTSFIGTTDAQSLVFKTNNVERMRLLYNGSLLLNTTTDAGYQFDVNGRSRVQSNMRIGSFAITKGADVAAEGVHQGIRVDDAQYAPIHFQTSNQGWVYDNFIFEGAFGTNIYRAIYANSSIIRITQGWGNPNVAGHNAATIRIDNEINNTSTNSFTVRGIYYNPTVTNLGGGVHIAYENTTGANRLNTTSGNTLIGTSTDNGNKLQVNGTVWANSLHIPTGAGAGKVLTSDANGIATWQTASGGSAGWGLTGNSNPGAGSFIGTTDANPIVFKANNIEGIRIGTDGKVGIGGASMGNGSYKLYVQGDIRARKVRIDTDNWSDYVFEQDYKLLSLDEVEKYIQQHRHLPDVPSAAEVAKEGIDVSDNQAVLLKKIEELTLYVIEQNKLLKQQQERIEVLEKKATGKK